MMNKKRTHKWGKAKYLIFIPIIALLLILSNIESVSRLTKGSTKDSVSPNEQTQTIRGRIVDEFGNPLATIPVTIKGSDTETRTNMDGQFTLEATESATVVVDRTKRNMEVRAKDIKENSTIQLPASEGRFYTLVDDMPQFQGGDRALLSFLSKNIRYPKDAIENGIKGRVVASFIINTDGNISDIEIEKSVYPSLDKEAIRVLNTMPLWTPGRHKGKEVPVKYVVPITFALDMNSLQSINNETAYKVAHKMPEYPGGENELMRFIARNIKYPESAQHGGIQGRVICSFIVEKDGSITNTEIVKGIDPALDNEAIRVINSMPIWTPGTNEGGEAIRVEYTIPITYRLQ